MKKLCITLILCFSGLCFVGTLGSLSGCSTKILEDQRDTLAVKRQALEAQIAAEGREPSVDEAFLLKALELERETLEGIIDKKLEGMSTTGAVAEQVVGFLPPPWGEVGGLAIALLGIGRARQNKRLAKNIAKAAVTVADSKGIINTKDEAVKNTMSAIMGPAGNALIAEAKGKGKTLDI